MRVKRLLTMRGPLPEGPSVRNPPSLLTTLAGPARVSKWFPLITESGAVYTSTPWTRQSLEPSIFTASALRRPTTANRLPTMPGSTASDDL